MRRLIYDFTPEAQVEEYHEIESLRIRLLKPKALPLIAVIVPLDFDDLELILSLDFLLYDLKVILILPDSREETIRHGHLLRPRFLMFADGQLSWVIEVMKKMMGRDSRQDQTIGFEGAAQ